jgi:hypothetical protein
VILAARGTSSAGSAPSGSAGAPVGRGEDVEFLSDAGHESKAAGAVLRGGLPGAGAAGQPGWDVTGRAGVALDGGGGVELLVNHASEAGGRRLQERLPRTQLRTRRRDEPHRVLGCGGGFSFGHL